MKRIFTVSIALLLAAAAEARSVGFGIDAFNRVIPASASSAAVFSPVSFEIDCVIFAEASDTIRRSIYSDALRVQDEFVAEYGELARAPLAAGTTNRFRLAWARALVFDDPRRVSPTYRLTIQEDYGAEVSRARPARGIEAWAHARLGGAFNDWRLPPLPSASSYAFHDLVSLDCEVAPSNALKRAFPSMTVYRQPLLGGCDFYALVPKAGRPVSSIRARLTSATIDEILSMSAALVDPPAPVRLALPPVSIASTNDLTGAFAYFRFPTSVLKPFPAGVRIDLLRQTIRFRLRAPTPTADAEPLSGPFLFFVHDPKANALPVAGVCRDGDARP